MLTELAICDAYGAGFEFYDANLIHNDVTRFIKHPTHGHDAGMYTDDTQRTIANVLAILDENITLENLAEHYVGVFKRDPRKGYARGYQAFLESVSDADDYLRKIRPDSDKSGACMSAAVFGLYAKLVDAKRFAVQQATITHNTTDGKNTAAAVAAAAWFMRNKEGKRADLGHWLDDQVEGEWGEKWDAAKVSVKATDCARAAVYIVRTSGSMKEIMQRSVALKGDVDTVACIAGAIASLSEEIKQDIPQVFYETLENGRYGRDYLGDLNKRLMDHFEAGAGR